MYSFIFFHPCPLYPRNILLTRIFYFQIYISCSHAFQILWASICPPNTSWTWIPNISSVSPTKYVYGLDMFSLLASSLLAFFHRAFLQSVLCLFLIFCILPFFCTSVLLSHDICICKLYVINFVCLSLDIPNGKKQRIAVQVGSNSYIVSANLRSNEE